MSELIAEARVLVTPDTTKFRPLLIAELATATKGIVVPVQVAPVVTGAATAAAATSGLANAAVAAGATADAIEGAKTALDRVDNSAKNAGRSLAQAGRGAGAAGLSFLGLRGATLAAGGAFLTGAASIAVLGKSIQSFSQLQTELNVFETTADATAGQMERIGELARELGRDLTLPGVTANTAAAALSQLARAGLSIDDSMAGVRGTLQLATAAAIDTEQAVLLTAGALNAFSLSGEEASRVADLLAASSKESQGSIVDMGLSLQQSAAAAAQAGVSVEDTIALLTQLGRAGLRGSDAGTSLRVALLRLIAPTKQAKEALEGLNVEIRDQAGNVRPEVFAEITSQLSKFSRAQRDATLALIFGQDAFRAASIIGREGAVGLREMQEATQEVGVAAELAAARTQGLAGAAENLKNQFQAAGTGIGSLAAGPLTSFLNSMATATKGVSDFIGFVGRIGDDTPRAEKSISELADEFARLNEEAGGGGSHEEAVARVRELGTAAAVVVLDFAELTQEAGKANAELAKQAQSGQVFRSTQNEVNRLNDELVATQTEGLKARDAVEGFALSLDAAGDAAEGLANRVDESFDRMATAIQDPRLTTAQGPVPIGPTAKLEGQAAIASAESDVQALLEIRQRQVEQAQRAFENASNKNVADRTKLFNDLRQKEAAVITVRAQIAAEQSQAQATAERDAAQAQNQADQAFLQRQENARTALEQRVTLADDTPAIQDDIRRRQQLRSLIKQQIEAIRASALDEKTKQQAVRVLQAAVFSTTQAIKRLRDTQREQREEEQQAAQQERTENLALRTQIAEARGNDAAVIQAIDAQIADAKKAQARAKKGSQEWLKATLALEELRRKRRDLLNKAEETAREGFGSFEFLQRQQGFAANLLGNLIPGFATAGLVGNTSNQPITDPGAGFAAEVPTANFFANQDRGVRPVQVDTTNQLLRQILFALTGTNPDPPEITQNRRNSKAAMDTM